MSAIIAKVSKLAGEFTITKLNGSTRELLENDEIQEGDVVSGSKRTSNLNTLAIEMTDGTEMLMLGDESQLFDSSLLPENFSENETVSEVASIDAMIDDDNFIDNDEVEVDELDTEAGEESIDSHTSTAPQANFAQISDESEDINAELRDIQSDTEETNLDNEDELGRVNEDSVNSEISEMVENLSELIDSANAVALTASEAAEVADSAAETANLNPSTENLEAAERAQVAANIASVDAVNAATELENAVNELNAAARAAGEVVNTTEASNAVADANAAATTASNAAISLEATTDAEIGDMTQSVSNLTDAANTAADTANAAATAASNAANAVQTNPSPENLEAAEDAQRTASEAATAASNAASTLEDAINELNAAATAANETVDTTAATNAVDSANAASTTASNAVTSSETITDAEISDMTQNVSDLVVTANAAAQNANDAATAVSEAVALANSNPTLENLNNAQNLQEEALEAANNSLNAADALESAVSELNVAATAAGEVVDSRVLASANDAVENVDTSADNANQSANLNLHISTMNDSDASDNSVSENVADGTYTGVTLNAVDVDGENVTYNITDDVPFRIEADGRVVVDGDNTIDYEADASYTFDATATSSDGTISTQSVTIDVNNINEAPTITSTQTVSIEEDNLDGFSGYGDTWSGNVYSIITQEDMLNHLNVSDSDSSSFSVTLANTDDGSSYHNGLKATDSIFSNPTANTHDEQVVEITQSFLDTYPQIDAQVGDFYFDNVAFDSLAEGESANISFGVVVSDGELTSEVKTVNIEIQGSNEVPVITLIDTTATEDLAQVIANISDIDGTIDRSSLSAENGTVTIAENGDITYTPDENYNGTDSVTIAVTDNSGAVVSQTFSVEVAAVNDVITQVEDADTTENIIAENAADGTYTGVTLNAVDMDGEALTYSIADGVPFSVNAEGQVVTNGIIDFETTPSYTFDVTATSTDGTSSTQSVTVDVANVAENMTAQMNDIDIVSANFDEGFRFETDIVLEEGSNTFFRQQDSGQDSFLIEFGTEGFENGLGNYIQVYVPTDEGVYRYEGDTPVTYNDLSHIEVVYVPGEGVTISLNGTEMGMSYTDGMPGIINTVTDDNYVLGDTSRESFNGEVENVSITTLADGSVVFNSNADENNSLTVLNDSVTTDAETVIDGTSITTLGAEGTGVRDGVATSVINTQSFSFGSEHAGETVTLTFDSHATGGWEDGTTGSETRDTFTISANGSQLDQRSYDENDDADNTWDNSHSYDVILDADGNAVITFDVASTASDEIVEVNDIQVTLSNTLEVDESNLAVDTGSGNDTIIVDSSDLAQGEDTSGGSGGYGHGHMHGRNSIDGGSLDIDGGDGLDTLVVTEDANIDFSGLNDNISNIETIDLGTGAQNITSLTTADVLDMTDTDNLLRIDGDEADSITLDTNTDGEWSLGNFKTDSETEQGYQEYIGTADDGSEVIVEVSTDVQVDQS